MDDLLKSSETKRTELEQQFKGLAERMMNRHSVRHSKPRAKAPASLRQKSRLAKKACGSKAASSAASKAAGATKKAADQREQPLPARPKNQPPPKPALKPRQAGRSQKARRCRSRFVQA
ncbi:MAG: hypothetical protein WKG07_15945 [Hymenobacter sp.]